MTPWDPEKLINKAMNARSDRMNAERDAQLALEAADRKAEVVVIDTTKGDTDAEGLEVVVPMPADPSAYR